MIVEKVFVYVYIALVAIICNLVGPLDYCSALVSTPIDLLSKTATISTHGPLTSVRARQVSIKKNQLSLGGNSNEQQQEQLSALNKSNNQLNGPIKAIQQQQQQSADSNTEPTTLKGRLVRRASDFGSYFMNKIKGNYELAQSLCSTKADELKQRMETNYLSLIVRFSKWYQAYKMLYQSNRDTMISPMVLIKQEFAEIDSEIYGQEMDKARELADGKLLEEGDLKKIESMDYLFRVLKQVIEKLELDLQQLQDQPGAIVTNLSQFQLNNGHQLNAATATDVENDKLNADTEFDAGLYRIDGIEDEEERKKKMDEAINRAIGIVKRATTKFVIGEIAMIAQLALLDSLAQYIIMQPDNPIGQLFPIVGLIGSANTPLLTSYMRNLQIRATLNFVGLCNPIPGTLGKLLKVKVN